MNSTDDPNSLSAGEVRPRPAGTDDGTVEALGKLSEALETVERARGHLYSFHQLSGRADAQLQDAAGALGESGHQDLASRLSVELVGRNVLSGRWTFQLVEEYDDDYWGHFRELERDARERLAGGARHLHEAEMKDRERSAGRRGHEATPDQVR
jgi:hypothetical protein